VASSTGAPTPTASPRQAPPIVEQPAYNSLVSPYVSFTGPYSYVAKGAALRDQGYGQVDLTWTGSLVAAYLVWESMDNAEPPAIGVLNGVPIVGDWVAYASPSPCWAPEFIYTFVAEVSGIVVNGLNNLTGFPSGVTNGGNPWTEPQLLPMLEGASLIVVYDSGAAPHQITIFTGALTEEGSSITAVLPFAPSGATTAETTYVFADGQYPGNAALWNGAVIDPDAFPGSDPKETPTAWSYGNLSDTKTYTVPVSLGETSATAGISSSEGDCLTWAAQVVSVQVPPVVPPYYVVFVEKGLPTGTNWGVTLGGTSLGDTVTGVNSSVNFTGLLNGSYAYTIRSPVGYVAFPFSGSIAIEGGNVSVLVPFHPPGYTVTFQELGLPAGTHWTVVLDAVSNSSTTPQIGFSVGGNGSYDFSVANVSGYGTSPYSGTVYVEGANVTVNVTFLLLYNVTFQETGLSAGTSWGADTYTNFGDFANTTTSASFVLALPNATTEEDAVCANSVPGYAGPCTYGESEIFFGVFGAPETIVVPFTAVYAVTFNETGMPKGYLNFWDPCLTSPYSDCYGWVYAGNNLTEYLTDGSYSYQVAAYNRSYEASPGAFTVNGGAVVVHVVFQVVTFIVSFSEKGLPGGKIWSVELGNRTVSSAASTIKFTETNGSYPYLVTGPAGEVVKVLAPSGTIVVNGAAVVESLQFASGKTFTVTFTAKHLNKAQTWCVTLAGWERCQATSSTKYLDLSPGAYGYSVKQLYGQTITVKLGSMVIGLSGSLGVAKSLTVTITYLYEYYLLFTETGLPADTVWSVTIHGAKSTSESSYVYFYEPNGSYSYKIVGPKGYTDVSKPSPVVIHGAAAYVTVTFKAK